MEFKDYYAVLGVARNASGDELRRAYRKLARRYHPDVSKETDAEAKFKELGEAWDVLKDPEKRAAYDALGKDWRDGQAFTPPPGWDAGFEFSGAPPEDAAGPGGHSDFFEALFGHLRARQARHGQRQGVPDAEGWARTADAGPGQRRGSDHHARIAIALEDAYRGATRTITLRAPVLDAAGRVSLHERSVEVTIPPGVREGQHLRLAGQGSPGFGGAPNGDLYLEIGFEPHQRFRVDGRDVSVDLPVAPWEAALGAQVRVPTPTGPVQLTVPPGSGGGRKLRLRGLGIPGQPPGDFHAVLKIVVPPASDERARAAWRTLEQTLAFDPREGMDR